MLGRQSEKLGQFKDLIAGRTTKAVRNWVIAAGALVFIAICVFVVIALVAPDKYTIRISTGGKGGTYYPLGKGLAKVINRTYPHLNAQVLSSAGASHNMKRLLADEAEIAFVQNDTSGGASIRTVAPLYREVLHVLVRKSSRIKKVNHLKGKRVSVGGKKSGTINVVRGLLQHYGIGFKQFKPRYLGSKPSAKAITKGKIDAFFAVSGIKSSAVQSAIASGRVDFLGFGKASRIRIGMVEGFRFDYPFAEPYVIPVLTYATDKIAGGGLPTRPVATIAIRAVLVTRSDVPLEVVRNVTKAIFAGRQELVRAHSNASQIEESFDAAALQFPLHEGATSYYRRDDPGFLVTYAESMGFILSSLVAVAMMFAGFKEMSKQKKKNRIDTYYLALYDIQTKLHNEKMLAAELSEIRRDLFSIEQRAFRQLVDEELMADESFRIFQNLLQDCNDRVTAQLEKQG